MSHVNVPAVYIDPQASMFDLEMAGAFQIKGVWSKPPRPTIHCICPCGCGSHFVLNIYLIGPDNRSPSWQWNNDYAKPTLSPSIRQMSGCKWHGYLENGIWKPCPDSGQ